MIFVLTLAAGIGFGGSENISERISNYLHHDCARWDEQTLERSFTLKEIKPLLGKKVHFKDSKLYPGNNGRAAMIYIVGYDKFLLTVNWKIDPDNGEERLRLYGKNDLPNLEFDD